MDTVSFECKVNTSDSTTAPLQVDFVLDDAVVLTEKISKETHIQFDIPNTESKKRILKINVSGKNQSHTKINQSGEVVSDTYLTFNDFFVDGISLEHTMLKDAWPYNHNFNGYGNETVDQFLDFAGCNGTITFEFATPFYVWLLENM